MNEPNPMLEPSPAVGQQPWDETREERARLMAVRDELKELTELSEKAEGGDKDTRLSFAWRCGGPPLK